MLVGADVTEQVLSHKKIESNEEKLNIVIDASDLGTWELNVKTNEATYSKRYLEILGYEQDARPTHAQLLMHLHPEDLPVRAKAFKEAFETGYLHYESRLVWDDKSIHWMEGRGKLFYDEDQKPWKMIGTIRDITEEKKNQQQLEESEKIFRNLVMQSPIPKAILRGADHIVEMANTALLQNIWRKNESDVGREKKSWMFSPELREQKYAALLDQVYNTGKKYTGTDTPITLRGNDGVKTFFVDFEYAPLFEADNHVSGIKITAIDVTEKVLARKKIEESENELRILSSSLEKKVLERTRQLEQKNDDLEKMNKELQSFAYISSHDLQEPLRKIQTFATRLIEKEKDQLSEYAKEQFKKMQVSAERMQSLIDDLLAYSRTNTAERKFEKINLATIIEEVKDDLQEELKEMHAIVETTSLCEVNVVRFQFRQLMHNLIGNSLKFSKPGQTPVIRIGSHIDSGANLPNDQLVPDKIYCYITVTDNGIGFEQQYSGKIFELFQRLHARSEFNGTGIGLAIVKKIVENHNGFIAAKSELNKGATFEIYLPVY
jgi:PAS domain S-box-containing protein